MTGGTLMFPLVGLCLMIFASGAQLWRYFKQRDFKNLDESTWQHWVREPSDSRGEVGEMPLEGFLDSRLGPGSPGVTKGCRPSVRIRRPNWGLRPAVRPT